MLNSINDEFFSRHPSHIDFPMGIDVWSFTFQVPSVMGEVLLCHSWVIVMFLEHYMIRQLKVSNLVGAGDHSILPGGSNVDASDRLADGSKITSLIGLVTGIKHSIYVCYKIR